MVEITPDRDIRCNHLFLRLRWHTEGRGTRDEAQVAQEDLFQGVLAADRMVTYPFRLTLPYEPWSYAGHYINIIWEVVAELDIPMGLNSHCCQLFIMAPPDSVIYR